MENKDVLAEINRYYKLWHEITQLYMNWSKEHGSTYNAILTIRTILEKQDYCTSKMICDKWGLPKQTVSTILKEFEKKGYVTFSDSTKDKRHKVISLTEKGRTYAIDISEEIYLQDIEVVNKMGIDKIKELNQILTLYAKYYREIGKDDDNY